MEKHALHSAEYPPTNRLGRKECAHALRRLLLRFLGVRNSGFCDVGRFLNALESGFMLFGGIGCCLELVHDRGGSDCAGLSLAGLWNCFRQRLRMILNRIYLGLLDEREGWPAATGELLNWAIHHVDDPVALDRLSNEYLDRSRDVVLGIEPRVRADVGQRHADPNAARIGLAWIHARCLTGLHE